VTGFESIKRNFGFGCMRLPMKGAEAYYDEFTRMVDMYMDAGFNYFDTARVYLEGQSETAIRDCIDGCPKHICIPDLFSCLNAMEIHHSHNSKYYYDEVYTKRNGKASDCLKCGRCERSCPQHLHIRELLQKVAAEFEKQQ